MTISRTRRLLAALALGVAAVACSDDGTGPGTEPGTQPGTARPQDQLTFLRLAPDAPAPVAASVSFWAVRGRDREVSLWLRPRPGRRDSVEFLTFKVGANSLLRYPDGRSFAQGDSVRIGIRLIDPSRLIFEFTPSGLRFSPSNPAELEIEFDEIDDDVNRDGRVDSRDDIARRSFAIWRQGALGQPWERISSEVDFDDEEVEADIVRFSNHAIAY